jgi:hypothetical protein
VIYFATSLQTSGRFSQQEMKLQSKISSMCRRNFGQDGGGKDFDDEFHYWINKQTHKVDYLAYSYRTNDGSALQNRF